MSLAPDDPAYQPSTPYPKAPVLPTTLRIGFKTYNVTSWPLREAFSAERFGECDNTNNVIRIAAGRSAHDTAETLLHEVFHACWQVAQLPTSEEEERAVSCLSAVLGQVYRDNPELLDYLAGVYAL